MRRFGWVAFLALALSAGCDGEQMVDAGDDAGSLPDSGGGGGDAGRDAGMGEDAEVPPVDGGSDAGMDAGMTDAGMTDAGIDAGPLCGNGAVDSLEQCDGTMFGGATCETELGLGATGTLACNGCVIDDSNCQRCGNTTIEGTEECDGTTLGGATCATQVGAGATGTLSCNACVFDTSACELCGDGAVQGLEECDGTSFGTSTCATELGAGATGALACNACAIDSSGCQLCGDGAIQGTEECEGTNFGTATCATEFATGATGALACNACAIDASACQLCGDGMITGAEQCDGTNLGTARCSTVGGGFMSGVLACNACAFDTAGCSTVAAPAAGSLVISEVMQDPAAFADADGEWFEIHNPGAVDLNLQGCVVNGTGGAADSFTITTPLVAPAGGYLTFAVASATAGAPGFTASYEWTGSFALANSADGIAIVCDGTTIDSIAYDNGATFPDPTGVSMTLDARVLNTTANDAGANWCTALSLITTDRGTPNAANDPCAFPITNCRLQFPVTIDTAGGTNTTVFGRVGITGITDATPNTDAHPRVRAEVGFGPDGSDPATDATWVWTTAAANTGYGPGSPAHEPTMDEYQGTITAPYVASQMFDYAYRFSGDTGRTWTVCDSGTGSSNGYSTADAGAMTVTSPVPMVMALVPGTIDVMEGGGTGLLVVQLSSGALAGGFTVNLMSSMPTSVAVPASVTIPPGSAMAAFRVRGATAGSSVVTATGATGMAMAVVNVVSTAPAPVSGDLLVNEITYDPPDLGGDANCDGVFNQQQDEHFEMINVSAHPILLDGASMWDNTAFTDTAMGPRFTFPAFVLGPLEVVLIYGQAGGTVTTSPWCTGASPSPGAGMPFRIGDAVAFASPVSDISLGNSGDTIRITATNVRTSTLLLQQGYASGVSTDQAFTRSPDVTGTFTPFNMAPGHATDRAFSPGTLLTGAPFASASAP